MSDSARRARPAPTLTEVQAEARKRGLDVQPGCTGYVIVTLGTQVIPLASLPSVLEEVRAHPVTGSAAPPPPRSERPVRTETGQEQAAGFRITPAGEFSLRDYSHEDPARLTGLRADLEKILTEHKTLIPGNISRLVIQWHADVCHALDTGAGAPDGGNHAEGRQ